MRKVFITTVVPTENYTLPTTDEGREHIWATVKCLECQKLAVITRKVHTVDARGNVSPSYQCPNVSRCDFHAFVRLENWQLRTANRLSNLLAAVQLVIDAKNLDTSDKNLKYALDNLETAKKEFDW